MKKLLLFATIFTVAYLSFKKTGATKKDSEAPESVPEEEDMHAFI